MAIRGSVIVTTPEFLESVRNLRSNYPDVDRRVNELARALLLDYEVREGSVEESKVQLRYALLDQDEQVLGLAVLFDATPPAPSPVAPYRTITLRRVVEVRTLPNRPEVAA